LEKLGCQAIFVNEEPTGLFPRALEPLPENLKDLCKKVKAVKADIGFAVDPDVDRLAIVS
jgi:phosphomannomutase